MDESSDLTVNGPSFHASPDLCLTCTFSWCWCVWEWVRSVGFVPFPFPVWRPSARGPDSELGDSTSCLIFSDDCGNPFLPVAWLLTAVLFLWEASSRPMYFLAKWFCHYPNLRNGDPKASLNETHTQRDKNYDIKQSKWWKSVRFIPISIWTCVLIMMTHVHPLWEKVKTGEPKYA